MTLDANDLTLALLVFVAETCVVTLATLRIIFISRGLKMLASVMGFFEITLWLFAIGQIMQNLEDVGCFLGFACGFTLGNYLGVLIEKKLALGTQVVRIITSKDADELVAGLREAGYGVTRIHAEGATGPVQIVFTVLKRKEVPLAVAVIKQFDRRAFYSVEDIQLAAAGVFPREGRTATAMPSVPRLSRRAA
jgi:uncharacterized protein YebE (UPF0316 family)